METMGATVGASVPAPAEKPMKEGSRRVTRRLLSGPPDVVTTTSAYDASDASACADVSCNSPSCPRTC
ncbi:hypothetical protein GCM10023193_52470 [Planotetraspora kaengkrachanensis]|uniref:Uncharacterized protein n=1 Tax=Planotetraspora kaengkrachanensis TaxID=575193 RepID=A0A8J3M585_9ACTN|nr:hypothetical protein Pka01_25580 [Planotetraspora kaengkrachanensis]